MAITIKVDGTLIPNDWQAQQTSDPMAEVDLFKLSADLTESYPTSAPPVGEQTAKATKKSK